MDKKSIQRHRQRKAVFCSLNSIRELCKLLKTDQRRLTLMCKQPKYRTFTVPKRDGGERRIETPDAELKRILGNLNRYLQSVYLFEKPSAAFGFITGVKNDEDRRNILTNAKKHVGKDYLLNVDLKDFFHSVTREQIVQLFVGKPFGFKRELPDILADLTTYQGRLPMGTPTSPALSNFACRELDEQLQQYADAMLWTYTRYADDMSFSSNQLIAAEKVNSTCRLIEQAGFQVNYRKVKVYGPDDDKIVTGLLVTDKVDLTPDFLPKLEEEIQHLKAIMIAQNEQGQISTKWVEQLKQQIRGRLSFAGFVLKRGNEQYIALKNAYYEAINPPQEDFSAVSWRGFPYNF